MGPSGSEGPRPDGEPAPGDPGEVTAPYTPPTASTSTSDVPPPPPPLSGQPPAVASGWAPYPARQEIAPGLVLSSTLPRFVAYWLDGILLAIVGGVIGGILGAFGWAPSAAAPFDPSVALDYGTLFVVDPVSTALGVVLSAFYFIGSWTGGRRGTPAQRLLKLQVGNAFDGRALSFDQATRRWLGLGEFLILLGLIPGFGAAIGLSLLWQIVLLITTATSPTKQGLHDRLANSAVVRPIDAGNGVVMACLVILAIIVAISLLSIVALIFLGSQVSDILSAVGESV